MKLLVVTQSIDRDDPVLGFFHRWIEEFSRQCECVEVICLHEGRHAFPMNVRVHSLGKEKGRQSSFVYALRLLRFAWKLRGSYDAVFVHMNQEHILVAGWLWNLLRKPVALWYTHGAVSLRLRVAILFCVRVFTASAASMRVHTKKKRVVGHGLDLSGLPLLPPPSGNNLTAVTVGRISPVKRIDLMIEMLAKMPSWELVVAGKGSDTGRRNLELHAETIGVLSRVRFVGPIAHDALPEFLSNAHVFLHTSETGSLDKAPLEALAAGIPVLTTSTELTESGAPCVFGSAADPASLCAELVRIEKEHPWSREEERLTARKWVKEHHTLPRLVSIILSEPWHSS